MILDNSNKLRESELLLQSHGDPEPCCGTWNNQMLNFLDWLLAFLVWIVLALKIKFINIKIK